MGKIEQDEVETLVAQGWKPRIKRVKSRKYITIRKGAGEEKSLGPYDASLWMKLSSLTSDPQDSSRVGIDRSHFSEIYNRIIEGASFEKLVSEGNDPYVVRKVFRDVRADSEFLGKVLVDKNEYEELAKEKASLQDKILQYEEAIKTLGSVEEYRQLMTGIEQMRTKINRDRKELVSSVLGAIGNLKPKISQEIRNCIALFGVRFDLITGLYPIERTVNNIERIIKDELCRITGYVSESL